MTMHDYYLSDEEVEQIDRRYAEQQRWESLGRTWIHGPITSMEIRVGLLPDPLPNLTTVSIRREGDPIGYRKTDHQPTQASIQRVLRAIAKLAQRKYERI